MMAGMHRHTSSKTISALALAGGVAWVLMFAPAVASAGSDMRVKRHNNYDQHVAERERRERAKAAKEKREAYAAKNAARAEARSQRLRNGGKTDDEIELESFTGRTLGGACMYGPDDEVIYRPRGARCKGDPPPPAEQRKARAAHPAAPDAAPVERVVRRKSKSTMIPRIRNSSPRKERCVWLNGRIAFQPKGVDCYAK